VPQGSSSKVARGQQVRQPVVGGASRAQMKKEHEDAQNEDQE
jgi:hypothetical protein